jgi:prevent-host-death family protein
MRHETFRGGWIQVDMELYIYIYIYICLMSQVQKGWDAGTGLKFVPPFATVGRGQMRVMSDSTKCCEAVYSLPMTTTAEVEEFSGKLADLVKQVQAGNEVVLTQGHKPVAKIVPTAQPVATSAPVLHINSLKGHKVLTARVSQAEIADDLFSQ